MQKPLRTWLLLAGPLAGWTLAWVYVWQAHLFARYGREAGPGLTVFEDAAADLRILWIAAGIGLFLSAVGASLLVSRAIFASESPGWSRVWLVAGALLTILGLSLPILFPSKTIMVIDEQAAVIAVESRWLYAETAEVLPFDQIARVNLRIHRTLHRVGSGQACQVGTGLSIVRRDRTWLEVRSGFDHEAVATGVAEAAGVRLDRSGADEC